VHYPFLASHPQYALAKRQMSAGGTLVTFDIKGGKDATFRFLDALRVIDISNNLGDSKSLITHPATTTHMRVAPEERAKLGISEGSVRLSIGLEDVEDLIEDISIALDAAAGTTPAARPAPKVEPAPKPAKSRAKGQPDPAEPAAKPVVAKAPAKAAVAKPSAKPAPAPEGDLFQAPPEAAAPKRRKKA
jgi:O-succinylhomoserine sulfhydrylase